MRLAGVAPREGLRVERVYSGRKPISGQAASLSVLTVRSARPKHPLGPPQSGHALPREPEKMHSEPEKKPFEKPIPPDLPKPSLLRLGLDDIGGARQYLSTTCTPDGTVDT